MTFRVFVVAGEPSGDLHASKMVKGLLQDSNILVDACGSKNLRKVGANCFLNSDKLAVMGFGAFCLLP